jgi:translation initiation factor IF-1
MHLICAPMLTKFYSCKKRVSHRGAEKSKIATKIRSRLDILKGDRVKIVLV